MKKLIFVMAGLIMMSVISAQSLDEIVKKYTEANKLDKVANLKTIKITAKHVSHGDGYTYSDVHEESQ